MFFLHAADKKAEFVERAAHLCTGLFAYLQRKQGKSVSIDGDIEQSGISIPSIRSKSPQSIITKHKGGLIKKLPWMPQRHWPRWNLCAMSYRKKRRNRRIGGQLFGEMGIRRIRQSPHCRIHHDRHAISAKAFLSPPGGRRS